MWRQAQAHCWRLIVARNATRLHCFRQKNAAAVMHGGVPVRAFAAAAADEFEIDRHFIAHDLAFPFSKPNKNEEDAAAQEVWTKAGGDADQVVKAITSWKKDGNAVTPELVNSLLIKLCARDRYYKAYSFMKWVIKAKPYELTNLDKLRLLHLTTFRKQHKTVAAYKVLDDKTNEAHEWLLTGKASLHMKTAKKFFNKMVKEKWVTSAEPYNAMIAMYLRQDKVDKAEQVFADLKASEIKPNASTYKILMGFKGELSFKSRLKDDIKAFLEGLKDTKGLSGKDWKSCIVLCGDVGKAEMVQQLWNEMTAGGYVPDSYYFAAAEAFAKLGQMSKFEELCTEVVNRSGSLPDELCFLMLKVYSEQGQMDKVDTLYEQFRKIENRVDVQVYHYVVGGYLKHGQPKKAVEIMKEALDKGFKLALYYTLLLALDACAQSRDLEGAEKLVHMLQTDGRRLDPRVFNGLLKAYVAAEVPVFGMNERMTNYKVVPNEETKKLLNEISRLSAVPVPSVFYKL